MANKISNNTAAFILHDLYCAKRYDDPYKEKMKLLKAAAKLISNDLKTAYTDTTLYLNLSRCDLICWYAYTVHASKNFAMFFKIYLAQRIVIYKYVQ